MRVTFEGVCRYPGPEKREPLIQELSLSLRVLVGKCHKIRQFEPSKFLFEFSYGCRSWGV
jgi:hypothetical protein